MRCFFTFLVCVLSLTLFQNHSLSADCGCGKKKPIGPPPPQIFVGGGCSCEDGDDGDSDELPIVQVNLFKIYDQPVKIGLSSARLFS